MNGRLLMALGGHNKAVLGSGGPRLVALEADLTAPEIQLLSFDLHGSKPAQNSELAQVHSCLTSFETVIPSRSHGSKFEIKIFI